MQGWKRLLAAREDCGSGGTKLGFTGEWQLTRDAGMAGAKDGGTKPQVLVGDEVGRGQGPEKLL